MTREEAALPPPLRPQTRLEYLRSRFIAGLITIVPTLVTIWVLGIVVGLLDRSIGGFIRPPIEQFFTFLGWPQRYVAPLTIGVSLVLTILFVLSIGILTRFLFVKRLIRTGENLVERIPLIRFFYITPREVLRTLTRTQRIEKRAVLVEFPRKGCWVIGYATGDLYFQPGNRHMVTVFLPTTPNPTSGYLLIVPAEDVQDMNMPTEDAVRFVISGGILSPSNIHMAPFTGFDKRPDLPPAEPLTTDMSGEFPKAKDEG